MIDLANQVTNISSSNDFLQHFSAENSLVIDVRNNQDFESGHIKNAQNVDLLSDQFLKYFTTLNKATKVFLYCADSSRSTVAVRILSEMGFENLFHFSNGLNETAGDNIIIE